MSETSGAPSVEDWLRDMESMRDAGAFKLLPRDGLELLLTESTKSIRAILTSGVLDQIRAEAWDEGYRLGVRAEATDEWGADPNLDNPYRATEAKP